MWQDDALCLVSGDPDAWFSEEISRVYRAKVTCLACPVRAICEQVGREAVHNLDPELRPEDVGMYGGLTGRELGEAEGLDVTAPHVLIRDKGLGMLARNVPDLEIAKRLGVKLKTVREWAYDARRTTVAA